MKASEFRAKSENDLKAELLSLTKAQFVMRMQVATQQMTNTAQFREMRRDVARVKTVLTEKKGAQK